MQLQGGGAESGERRSPGRLEARNRTLRLFSVIILNWNGRHLLEECLSSIRSQTFRDFETIVVDNGSTDGSVDWVKERWADSVSTVALPSNLGFAGGNNAGIRLARGRYVILLNNDTAVDPGWLAAMDDAVRRHPDAGMFTPKILNYYRRDEIDNTGHLIYPDGMARGRHRLEKDDGRFDEEGEVLSPSGCAGCYRRRMLDEIGLLDDAFFAYGEDVDLGLRGRWAGWISVSTCRPRWSTTNIRRLPEPIRRKRRSLRRETGFGCCSRTSRSWISSFPLSTPFSGTPCTSRARSRERGRRGDSRGNFRLGRSCGSS